MRHPAPPLAAPPRRAVGALGGATLGAAAALAIDPFGPYRPEEHVLALLGGAALGGLAGALLPSLAALPRRARWGSQAAAGILAVGVAHPAAIAAAFTLATDRRVLLWALLGGAIAALAVLRRGWGALEAALLLCAPVAAATTVQQARFLRAPRVDCAAVARQPGVHALSTWPEHVDPRLTGALVYDVVHQGRYTAAAFVQQGENAGCGAVVVWEEGGGHTLLEAPFRSGSLSGAPSPDGCWMTARLVLDGDRLFVPLSSYDGTLPPRLLSWTLAPGPTLTPGAEADLPLDPSDVRMVGERLVVLAYPRRFAQDGSSALAAVDPETLETLDIQRFEPNGWMTEYLVPAEGALYATDVLGHLYEFDPATLALRRKTRPGASMLGGDATANRLYVAAPYRRAALEIDRADLRIVRELPGGDAMRDLSVDEARRRLYGVGYGDGRLRAWDLEDGRTLGSLLLGAPLRALSRDGRTLWTAGGCGVMAVDEAALEVR